MNLFQVMFLDTILVTFPILIYLIYLSTNKNITDNNKKMYLRLVLLTSFFIIYNYGIKDLKLLSIIMRKSYVKVTKLSLTMKENPIQAKYTPSMVTILK